MVSVSETAAFPRNPVRVAIVEDDPFQRALAADLLGEAKDLELVGAHETGEAALAAMAGGTAADVVVVDLCLPGIGGAEVTRRLRALPRPPEVVVLTAHGERAQALEALKAGASGYLLKGTPGDLLNAVRVAASGGAAIAPGIARYLLDEVRVPHPEPGGQSMPLRSLGASSGDAGADPGLGSGRPALTRREREVLVLLAKGVTYEDAARVLGISLGTIQSHVKRLYRKLEVSSKAEAAAEAVRRGIANP
jgi:DNA-binding NarL/FixJ family response regulator